MDESRAIGGASVECPPIAPREIVTSVSTTRGDGRVFAKLLTAFTHESTSFLDCVSEGNGRNEGTVHFIPYRALHAGRTALIGRISSDRWRQRRMSPIAPREIVTSVSTTRGDGRVFAKLLTAFTHESTSFLDCVIEGNGRNEGSGGRFCSCSQVMLAA